jgi:hypothetical protein
MGKSETATAYIGLKILLKDLVEQMTEANLKQIQKMLEDGCIEDDNDYYNQVYREILCDAFVYDDNDDNDDKDFQVSQAYLTQAFQSKGSLYKSKTSSYETPDLHNGALWDRYLLVPLKELLATERWGYSRYGVNSAARPLSEINLSVDDDALTSYNNLQHTNVVFFLKQHSG